MTNYTALTQAETPQRLMVIFGNQPSKKDYLYPIADSLEKEWRQTSNNPNNIKKIIVTQNDFANLSDEIYKVIQCFSSTVIEINIIAHSVNEIWKSFDKIGYSGDSGTISFPIKDVANCFGNAITKLFSQRQCKNRFNFSLGSCYATQPLKSDLTVSKTTTLLNQSLAAKFLSALAHKGIEATVTGSTGEIVPLRNNN